MTIKKLDNILIVVDDLEAAKAFFLELGLELEGETTVEELTRLQQTIARRMAESKATAPEFVLTCEVDMQDAVESLRICIAADESVRTGKPVRL